MLTRPFPLGAPQAKPDSVCALLRQRRSINKPFNSLIFRPDLVYLMQHCLNSYKSALRLPLPHILFLSHFNSVEAAAAVGGKTLQKLRKCVFIQLL